MTQVGANRKDSLADAIRKTWARGALRGFYQGLIPWVSVIGQCEPAILVS
jgi:hypothetical protein